MEDIFVENKDITKNKLIQIFRFLQSMDQLRNPVKRHITEQPWFMWFHDIPKHDTIVFGKRVQEDHEQEDLDPCIVKVHRPELTECPNPPVEIKEWLEPGWKNINGKVSIIPFQEMELDAPSGEKAEKMEIEVIRFEDDENRVRLYEEWITRRELWVEKERPAREAMHIYEKLYDLYARMERDNEQIELLVGDGILTWNFLRDDIHHPLLLMKVNLIFNPDDPSFTLIEGDQSPELYSSLLRSIEEVHPQAIARCVQDLDSGHYHPLDGDNTEEYLKRLVTQLSAKGEFIGETTERRYYEHPIIRRDPVFFVRKRSLGFTKTIEGILEDLPNRETFPEAVTRIIGIQSNREDSQYESTPRVMDVNGEDEEVLLSKEANSEQLKIALQLDRYGSVLVQGPPGTGKTHTIANLLGHLLAQGKKVLVTSHTAKALSVLRDKVVKPLQSLCVSVLGSEEGKEQLEGSIDEINERLSSIQILELSLDVKRIEKNRKELLKTIRTLRKQLESARADEYRTIIYAGREYDPSKAAKQIALSEEEHSWIPSPVSLGEPLPITVESCIELYRSNGIITVEDESELAIVLPPSTRIMNPDQFKELVGKLMNLEKKDFRYRENWWKSKNQTDESLCALLNQLELAQQMLHDKDEWKYTVIQAGKLGGEHQHLWEDLLREIEEVYALSQQTKTYVIKYGPELSASIDLVKAEQMLAEIVEYLDQKQKIGTWKLLIKKDWKHLIQNAKINGKSPEQKEDFIAIQYTVRLQKARQQLLNRWQRQVTSIQGPNTEQLGMEPEIIARQYGVQIKMWLYWHEVEWKQIEKGLLSQAFDIEGSWSEIPTVVQIHGDLVRQNTFIAEVIKAVKTRIDLLQYEVYQNQINQLSSYLETFSEGCRASKVYNQLLIAIQQRNVQTYEDAYNRLVELETKRSIYEKRLSLIGKIRHFAPTWANAVQHRVGIHGQYEIPGDIEKAWEYRQLHDELEKRSSIAMEELQKDIAKYTEDFRRLTAELIENKAWLEQAKRTTFEQRQALAGWKALMRRVGKGTGKRAPIFLAEARRLMTVCQTAVPVWIMPISRVVESFDPKKNEFDVVIIDEASQSDVMALTALYFGKQVVVVGDDEQVSPDAVGQKLDEIQRMIDSMLEGIPNKQLYDGQTSIYDLAKTSFEGIVQLREHFRCVEPIIQFSNYLSYNGEIKPLRDASHVKRKPFTVPYSVQGTNDDKINKEEAVHVASLLIAASEQDEYKDATFGVISLVGDEQALQIDTLLRRYMDPVEYQNRRIRCGNSSQFQGDERSVIFLSMVHGPSGDGPIRRLAEDDAKMKKRYNVAVSRAQDQIWLVHSLNPNMDLKDGDLRKRLIAHMYDPLAIVKSMEQTEKRAESDFEKQVMRRLTAAGYRVTPQWKVGAYRIDMVVEGGGKRLAVECDGERWHPIEKLGEDMARQAILERLGWKFVRIRGSAFYRNPDKAMIPVFERLQELDIPPEGPVVEQQDEDRVAEELKNRIIRRAAEIRKSWEEQEDEIPFFETKKRTRRKAKNDILPKIKINLPKEHEIIPVKNSTPVVVNASSSSTISKNFIQENLDLDTDKDNTRKSLVDYFAQKGIEVIDMRNQGGSLWVVGGMELASTMEEFKTKGVRFLYSKNGSKATKNRSAWYTSYKG